MANNAQLSTTAQNSEANAVVALLDSGYLRIYTGNQPADANTAVSTQTQLAELRFASTAFGAASLGTCTASAITSDTDADATGTATWFRILKSDGSTVVFDGSAGTSGCDLNINTTSIQIHARVDISSFTFTAKAA